MRAPAKGQKLEKPEQEESDDETRSVKAEIDYTMKGAARHIVADTQTKKMLKLIDKMDNNQNKTLSQKSFKSVQSRMSNVSNNRRSGAVVTSPTKDNLDPIKEDEHE